MERHPAGALAKFVPGCPCTRTRLCPAHAAMIREGLRASYDRNALDAPGMYVVPTEDEPITYGIHRLWGFGGPF